MSCAISRGGFLSFLDSIKLRLVEKSPCSICLGLSIIIDLESKSLSNSLTTV